jgi:hypothetical protein
MAKSRRHSLGDERQQLLTTGRCAEMNRADIRSAAVAGNGRGYHKAPPARTTGIKEHSAEPFGRHIESPVPCSPSGRSKELHRCSRRLSGKCYLLAIRPFPGLGMRLGQRQENRLAALPNRVDKNPLLLVYVIVAA